MTFENCHYSKFDSADVAVSCVLFSPYIFLLLTSFIDIIVCGCIFANFRVLLIIFDKDIYSAFLFNITSFILRMVFIFLIIAL